MKIEDIVDLSAIALANVMTENMDMGYYERRMRRQFCERFHTSLLDVEKMSFVSVLTHLFEAKFEGMKGSFNEEEEEMLWDQVQTVVDPSFKRSIEDDNVAFTRAIAERELKKKKDQENLKMAEEQAKALGANHVKNTGSVQTLDNHVKNTRLESNENHVKNTGLQPLSKESSKPMGNAKVFVEDTPIEADGNGLDSLDDIVKI